MFTKFVKITNVYTGHWEIQNVQINKVHKLVTNVIDKTITTYKLLFSYFS